MSLPIAYKMKQRSKPDCRMAEGGQVTGNYQSTCDEHCNSPCEVHPQAEYDSKDYNMKHPAKHDEMAMHEDDRRLNEHGEMEEGPQGVRMAKGGNLFGRMTSGNPDILQGIGSIFAEGGQVTDNYQDKEHEMDMVGHIMEQRQKMYSKGGRVANDDMPEADFKPNEFDDLHLRDDLENSYTGANSGDELSNKSEDQRKSDMIQEIMESRRKRDRVPTNYR